MLLVLAGCAPRGSEALRRGDESLAAGRPATAVPLLERAVIDLPGHAVAWNHLGLAYQGVGRPDEARKAYLRALEFDRNLFDVHFNLGALEFEAGRWTETERAMRTYLGVEPNRTNVAAWRLLGQAQWATHQFDAAERTLAAAVQLAPTDPDLRNRLGLVLAQKRRWRDAAAQFSHVLRQDPESADARLNLAIVSQQSGDRTGALEHYRAYLRRVPAGPKSEAVQDQVRQLELLLAPPPALSTNVASVVPPPASPEPRPTVVTNPPPAVTRPPPVVVVLQPATNPPPPSVVTRPAPTPSPALPITQPTPTPTPTPTPPPTVVREPKPVDTPPAPSPSVEVVPVQEAPTLRVARDEPPPPAVVPSPEVEPTETISPPPAPAVPPEPTVTPPAPAESFAADPSTEASHRTFWQRVNPANWGNPMKWFRDKEEVPPSAASTEQPRAHASTVATPGGGLPANPAPEPTSPPPAAAHPPSQPGVPRHVRQTASVLEPGNRTAAETAAGEITDDRLAAWKKAAQLDPSWSVAWQQVGRLALESGHPAEALTAAEALIALEPQSAGAHQLFAAALARAGFPADAAAELEQAVTLSPGNASVHLALAGIYARDLAEPARARPHYEQVLALHPQHPQAAAIRIWLAANP